MKLGRAAEGVRWRALDKVRRRNRNHLRMLLVLVGSRHRRTVRASALTGDLRQVRKPALDPLVPPPCKHRLR